MRNIVGAVILTIGGCLSSGDGGASDGAPINIVGDEPEVASMKVAAAVCHYQMICPGLSTGCAGTADSDGVGETTCQVELDQPDDNCVEEIIEDVGQLLDCVSGDAALEQMVNDCVNAMTGGECKMYTQDELDQLEADLEMGEGPLVEEEQEQPEVCMVLQEACGGQSEGDSVSDDAAPTVPPVPT